MRYLIIIKRLIMDNIIKIMKLSEIVQIMDSLTNNNTRIKIILNSLKTIVKDIEVLIKNLKCIEYISKIIA